MWPSSPWPRKTSTGASRPCLRVFTSTLLLTLQVDSLVPDSSRSHHPHPPLHPASPSINTSSTLRVFTLCCMIHFQPPPQLLSSCTVSPPQPHPHWSGTHSHGLITAIHRGQGPDIIPQSSPAINNSTWIVRGICAAIFNAHNCFQCGVTKGLTQQA